MCSFGNSVEISLIVQSKTKDLKHCHE